MSVQEAVKILAPKKEPRINCTLRSQPFLCVPGFFIRNIGTESADDADDYPDVQYDFQE